MEITAAGNAIGAAKRAPPAAANAIPIVRKVLKNFGVGALTRSTYGHFVRVDCCRIIFCSHIL